MSIRFATASALALMLATPAFGACQDEISSLDETIVAAQTGAATDATGMPATQHQQQVIGGEATGGQAAGEQATGEQTTGGQAAGEQAASEPNTAGEDADSGVVTGAVEAASPHQKQVLREIPDEDRTKASTLLTEARDMAEAGDEQGCMDKVAEAKTLLGLEE